MRRIQIDHEELRRMIEDEAATQSEAAVHFGVHLGTIERRTREWDLRTAKTGPRPGARHPNWKGGRTLCKGYWYLYQPDHPLANRHGRVLEHRLVMERHLDRPLTRQEVVHHKNGDRLDNRIENLQVFDSNGDHLRHELKGDPIHALCVLLGLKRASILERLGRGDDLRTLPRNGRGCSTETIAKHVRLACEQLRIPCPVLACHHQQKKEDHQP